MLSRANGATYTFVSRAGDVQTFSGHFVPARAVAIKELGRVKWEKELQKRENEAELERLQYEVELEWLQYDAELEGFQSEYVEMPMFPLLEEPQQSAPTAMALAAEAPAAEVMTETRVFADTSALDASVERAALKLTSVAGSSSKICGKRRAFRNYNSSWPKHDSNSNINSSSNGSCSNSSSRRNDTTSNYGLWWDTTCVVALLRPFDPGKGCQRDARRGKAVLGVDLPFDRGKA